MKVWNERLTKQINFVILLYEWEKNPLKELVKDRSRWNKIWMRFRAGDQNAFSEIYEEFVDVMFSYGSKITTNRELLKDCIQEVFYNLYRYHLNLQHPEYLEFYLFRSLRNEIFQKIKRIKKESAFSNEGIHLFDLKFQIEQDTFEEESLEYRDETLRQILKTLDPQKRELLFLKFTTGLSYAEIGQLTGMTPDAVKKQVYRTLGFLRSQFGNKLLELVLIWVKN